MLSSLEIPYRRSFELFTLRMIQARQYCGKHKLLIINSKIGMEALVNAFPHLMSYDSILKLPLS